VDEVVPRVFERSDATKVVVFGSVQRGDHGPDSDIVLLVVLAHIERAAASASRAIPRAVRCALVDIPTACRPFR
jgi:predicted nucleotidyltransferase